MARSARRSPDAPAQSRSDQDSHTSSRTTSQSASTNTQTRTPPIPCSSGRAQRVNDTPASPRATNYSCRLGAGVITTPAVAFLACAHSFAAGIVISASHNPWQDNGIKLFGPDGYKLPDSTELAILYLRIERVPK